FAYFFFQAEDGIRDRTVTGVQTCALPISSRRTARSVRRASSTSRTERAPRLKANSDASALRLAAPRSEPSKRSTRSAAAFRSLEIGRASCRERVGVGVGGRGRQKRHEYVD